MISFEQVRRRKIVQWALAYVAAAWALLQVLALVADSFGWPRVVTRGGILLAGLGLLATLVISWYHGERGAQRVSGVEILLLAGLFVLAGATVVRLAPGREQNRGAAAGVGTQSKRPVARHKFIPAALYSGEIYLLMGRREEARRSLEEARIFLEARCSQDPADARAYAALGEVYAGLGRRREALSAAAKAIDLLPISRDALFGPDYVFAQARTLTALGDKDAALDRLESLKGHPWTVTPVQLRLEPWWDPLRGEPRFQRLAQGG